MRTIHRLVCGLVLVLGAGRAPAQTPVGSALTYQGELRQSGSPVSGSADLRFRLYTAETNGSQVGVEIPLNNATLSAGRFTAPLDFGPTAFGPDARWLEIDVRSPAGAGSFVALSPRQRIMPAPVAQFAIDAGAALAALDAAQLNGQSPSFYQNAANLNSGTIPDGRLAGTYSGAVTFSNAGNVFGGSGAGLTSVNADLLDGLNSTAFLQSIPVPLTLSGADASHVIQGTNSSATTGSAGLRGVSIANSGNTYGVYGRTNSADGLGVIGVASFATTGPATGVYGQSESTAGYGVRGVAQALSGSTTGVFGQSNSPDGRGVFGNAPTGSGANFGVYGRSLSTAGTGVFGQATASSGTTYGVRGEAFSPAGAGVEGTGPVGVRGSTTSLIGDGVRGTATNQTGSGAGVHGMSMSINGTGVFGHAMALTGSTSGVYGKSDSPGGFGVLGENTDGVGVYGNCIGATGLNYGVHGRSLSTGGRGVYGLAAATTGTNYGVLGISQSPMGAGVCGESAANIGVYGQATGTTGANYGLLGRTASTTGRGVYGEALGASGVCVGVEGSSASTSGYGVLGRSADNVAVGGIASGTAGSNYGVFGESYSSGGRGVYGVASAASGSSYGVRGANSNTAGYAVFSAGDLGCSGTKQFRIDHPADPENKYLIHYAPESPEVINFYSGKVTLDGAGGALVELPAYFASINKDPRYTLTAMGAPMPMLHIAEEISDALLAAGEQTEPGVAPPVCTFRIAGGVPGGRVSWEIKALRNDLRVRLHGAPVEREKTGPERGRYQHPEYYGRPVEAGMDPRSPRAEGDHP